MRGVAAAFEQARVMQHGWSGADRGDPTARSGLLLDEFADTHIAAKIQHTRSAGQKEQVVGFVASFGERRVGVHGDVATTRDMRGVAQCSDGDFGASAAQQVYGGDGFDFLKTLWQNNENRGHVITLLKMTALAPGFFKGKSLVVFGAGYVGGAVAAAAGALGARVTALTRNPAKVSKLAAEACDVVIDELASDAWHAKIGVRPDYVLNCVSSGGGGIEGYRRSYVDGMRSILAWAEKRGGVGTIVYTSSTSVYPQSGGARVDENAPITEAIGTPAVLFEAENLLRTASPSVCARWFVLRLAGIYGPQRHHLLDQLRAGETELGGRGDHRLNLIHRDDIVAAVLAAFAAPEKIANETFNVADDGAVSKAEVAAWLAQKIGRPAPRFTGEATASRRAVTPDRVISNDKIKTVLGWRPRYGDFRAGYRRLLEA